MSVHLLGSCVGLAVVLAGSCAVLPLPPTAMAHDVFLTLNRAEPALLDALVADCRGLQRIPGILELRAGTRALDMRRDRNDLEFDVALHIVFEDRAALDRYLIHPIHLELLKTWESRLRRIRVFDFLPGAAARSARVRLP